MLTPEFLAGCSDDIAAIWAEAESDILSDIARRLSKAGYVTETAEWQIAKAREVGMLSGDVNKILSDAYSDSCEAVDNLFLEAAEIAIAADNEIFLAAGIEEMLLAISPAQKAILLQGTKSTKLLLESYTHTTAQASETAFRNAADKAYLKIMSGATDSTSAVRQAINELARGNIQNVAYPTGVKHSAEAATRRAIVTGCNQSVAKLQLARASDLGCDLVEVSSHMGARPSHAEWQGQVYSLSGKHGKFKNFYDETGYGSGDGLCGWNCYHSFFPYYEGLSHKSFSSDPSKDMGHSNDDDYANSQIQRSLEREVRKAKQECVVINEAIKASNNPELSEQLSKDFNAAAAKLQRRKDKLDTFCDSAGLTRLCEREQVPNFGHSVSTKVVWANRKLGG